MPDSPTLTIPYERQTDPMSNRLCGAAALCMVYRSFGISSSQAELWPKLTPPGSTGNRGARTYLLAQDALARGLSALVIRAYDPLRTLQKCHHRLLRVILNHRPHVESPNGHFNVLVDFDGEAVIVHDPQVGPRTRILQSDLLKLWQPLGTTSEITGNVLVVLAKDPPSAAPCPRCGSVIPENIACPGCRELVALRPALALGCINDDCPERTWATIFCPHCDTDLMAGPGKDLRSPLLATAAPPDDPRQIKVLSREIDKFVQALLAANGGQPVPGSEPYFTEIREVQAKLLAAQKKEAAEERAKAAQPPPPPEPKPAPPPEPVAAKPPERKPVDWNALGLVLLKELGLLGEETVQRERPEPGSPGPQLTPRTSEITEFLRKKGMWK